MEKCPFLKTIALLILKLTKKVNMEYRAQNTFFHNMHIFESNIAISCCLLFRFENFPGNVIT